LVLPNAVLLLSLLSVLLLLKQIGISVNLIRRSNNDMIWYDNHNEWHLYGDDDEGDDDKNDYDDDDGTR